MSDPVLDLDQRLRAPLAALGGVSPPAPDWFAAALAQAPERGLLPVEGAEIEMLSWGERGRPGLLLVHGGMANADWWTAIAPFFARTHRVAALSLSGMGRSDWRPHYSVPQFAREMDAVARAAGLFEAGPPAYLAHSFGSRPLLHAASSPELAPGFAIVADMAFSPRRTLEEPPPKAHPHRVHPNLEAAVARFRLMPYQECDNLFLLDEIARQSLKRARGEDGREGWSWRFDPFVFERLAGAEWAQNEARLKGALCPLAFVSGDRSRIARPDKLAYTETLAPAGTVFTLVPEAAHHLFLDQPLAFVASVGALLAEQRA